MVWSRERADTLEKDLAIFLQDLCQEWDFCSPLNYKPMIEHGKILRAIDFTHAVLIADGLKPAKAVNWERRIKRKFVARYGQAVSEYSYLGN